MGWSLTLLVFTILLTVNNDWIQTTDLWCWKQQLYQLCHNHCLANITSLNNKCEQKYEDLV